MEFSFSFNQLFRSQEQQKKYQELTKLRNEVHERIVKETEERIRNNPTPNDTELRLGCFVEMLEPQVRHLIVELNRKGYTTISSGFGGENSELQVIDGLFSLDQKTRKQLQTAGMKVKDVQFWGKPGTQLMFPSQTPDLDQIKSLWDKTAEIFPDMGHPASPAITDAAEIFRQRYGAVV